MTENSHDQIFEFIEEPDDGFQWYVLFVANGKEFKIRDQICKIKEIKRKIRQIWIPSITKVVQGKTKEQIMQELILSGYIFILMEPDPEVFKAITEFEDVYHFLWKIYSDDIPSPIPPEEIKTLERGVNKKKQLHMSPYGHFNEKDRVRISNGIFKNLKGQIKEIRKNCIIIDLEEDVLHRKLSIMVSNDNLEKIH
jgi:transcription antitermination factor NusG